MTNWFWQEFFFCSLKGSIHHNVTDALKAVDNVVHFYHTQYVRGGGSICIIWYIEWSRIMYVYNKTFFSSFFQIWKVTKRCCHANKNLASTHNARVAPDPIQSLYFIIRFRFFKTFGSVIKWVKNVYLFVFFL